MICGSETLAEMEIRINIQAHDLGSDESVAWRRFRVTPMDILRFLRPLGGI
jgi:ArsR family metal-binding transcriptional regulator